MLVNNRDWALAQITSGFAQGEHPWRLATGHMRLPIRLGACACALGVGIAGGVSLAERQEVGDTLELVQVVFRHGEALVVRRRG